MLESCAGSCHLNLALTDVDPVLDAHPPLVELAPQPLQLVDIRLRQAVSAVSGQQHRGHSHFSGVCLMGGRRERLVYDDLAGGEGE